MRWRRHWVSCLLRATGDAMDDLALLLQDKTPADVTYVVDGQGRKFIPIFFLPERFTDDDVKDATALAKRLGERIRRGELRTVEDIRHSVFPLSRFKLELSEWHEPPTPCPTCGRIE